MNTTLSGLVMTIKLNSGEELITKVIGDASSDGFITIQEPVSIAPSQQGMQMIPSIFTADPKGEYKLNTKNITMYAETEDSVKMKYIEATTGIRIPEKKIITG